MIKRKLKVLILGDVPEVGDIFERRLFQDSLSASPTHINDHHEFEAALQREDNYDLVLIDITPYGIEVLDQVRKSFPACPVVMVGDPDQTELLLKAKRKGLEAYLLRIPESERFTDLLAEELYTQLKRFIEPPEMRSPSADQIYRYAQFHNVLEPFFVIAPKRYLLYVNKAGNELISGLYDFDIHVGDSFENWVLEDSLEEFSASLDRAFSGREIVREQSFERFKPDGHRELHYQPVTNPQGDVVAVSVAVSQPARPELQRARTMDQLTKLAARVSHENNNLLNVLMSNADLLSDRLAQLGDEEAMMRLEKIEKSIERATRFTRQLQDFSRTSVFRCETFNPVEVIEDVWEPLQKELPAQITLTADLQRDLPAVRADTEQWRTVIESLIQNCARDMLDGGELLVTTKRLRVTAAQMSLPVGPGEYVVLTVSYPGATIVDWLGGRNFDPFFAVGRDDRYSGLELATVKSVVEHGGGVITGGVRGDVGVIQIYYPTVETSESRAKPTILLVDDEIWLREAFTEILTHHGYQVRTADSVAQARAHFNERSQPLDLLLTDIRLAQDSGVELAEEITEKWPETAVVFFSGHARGSLPELEHFTARHRFLRKPIQIPTLLETVEEILEDGPR